MRTLNIQSRLSEIRPNLLSFAYTLTHNTDRAYDLLADTNRRALDCADRYNGESNFKGWVLTIMRGIFKENYCAAVPQVKVYDNTHRWYHIDEIEAAATDRPEGVWSTAALSEALGSIEEPRRSTFVMHISGYSCKEIARAAGLPLYRAMMQVLKAMKDCALLSKAK